MKRLAACVMAIVLVASMSGCAGNGGGSAGVKAGAAAKAGSSGSSGSSGAAASQPAKADPYEPIATDAPHEKAALAAVSQALQAVTSRKASAGQPPMPAGVSDAKRSLFSYTIAARTGGKEVLFEVRADGVAHSLFAYPAAPDPGKLLYVDMSLESGAATAAPTGKSELAAAAAVAAVMAKAKPGERIEVLMYGYHFAFIGADGQPVATSNGQPFEITIDPMGNLSAWT